MSDGVDMIKIISILVLSISLTSCALFSKDPTESRQSDIYYAQGTKNLVDQKYSEALKNLLKANELKSNDTDILNNLAMAYYFKKKPKTALKYLKRALEIDSKNSDARNNLATILMQQGKLNIAKKQYEIILNDLVYKKNFRVYYNLALIYLKQGNTIKAKELLVESVGHREDYCAAHYQLASIYEKEASYANAKKHYDRASRGSCKTESLPLYRLALLYLKMGKELMAKEYLLKIKKEFPDEKIAKSATKLLRSLKKKDEYRANNLKLKNKKNNINYDSGNF